MISKFTTTILEWFSRNARDLPWRQTRDPYAIWLSEIILQQTRVEQGTDYWWRLLQRFPTVEDLASATEDEVLRLWQGLGYYSRARNLHAAAQQIVAKGAFPDTPEALRKLKGIGDYTAAAIASIAFGYPAAAVDGNVYRVLARHYGIQAPINTTEGKNLFTELANELLPHSQAGAFNQALMDFGATVCTPRNPMCSDCPLADTCIALHEHKVDSLPVKLAKTKVTQRHLAYIYIKCNGYTAIHRRGAGDIWQGLWEPVIISGWTENSNVIKLETAPDEQHQYVDLNDIQVLARDVRHVLTHRILLADFLYAETFARPALPADYIWVPEAELDNYGMPRLVEKLLERLPSRT